VVRVTRPSGRKISGVRTRGTLPDLWCLSALLGGNLRSIGLAGVLFLLVGASAWGQSGGLVPPGQSQFVDSNGVPLAGGSVFFYVPGTTTPKLTYQDQFLSIPNANPVVLNAAGRAVIWGSGSYRQVVNDQFGALIWDQITNAPFNSSGSFMLAGVTACGGDTTGIEPNCRVPVLNPTATGSAAVPWFGVDSGGSSAINIPSGKALNIFSNGLGPVFSIQGNGTVQFSGVPFAQLFRGFIDGFETGAPGAGQVLTIGPGAATVALTSSPTIPASFASSNVTVTKTLGSFVVASGNGCLDTGTVAINSSYWFYLIQRTDTGAIDFLCSLVSSSPVVPVVAPFGYIRGPIAWFRTDSSANIIQYQQRGDEFTYGVAVQDVATTTLSGGNTVRTLFTLTVPSGFVVNALFRAGLFATAQNARSLVALTSPDETDQSAIFGGTIFGDLRDPATDGSGNTGSFNRRTNTSGQIGVRALVAGGGNLSFLISTYGFIWTRGRNN
jgi:hypothetical protein